MRSGPIWTGVHTLGFKLKSRPHDSHNTKEAAAYKLWTGQGETAPVAITVRKQLNVHRPRMADGWDRYLKVK